MAAINFPSSPSENDTYTHEGRTYLFTGGVWISQSASVSAGDGDVMSPGVAVVSGNLAAFDGTTGTAIEDSGYDPSDFASASSLSSHTGATTGAHGMTAFGASLVDDANAVAARTTLGLVIGTDVQPFDADLSTWAGVTPGTGIATALAVNVGTAGAPVINGGALGTPSGGTLTNATDLPLTTGVTGTLPVANGGTGITSLGSGVATFLGTPSSANLAAALTDETGTGANVFGTAPTLSNPTITNYVETVYTPSAGTAFTVDLANGTVQKLTSSGNLTITLPASVSGKSFIIIVAYGGTHTLTWAGATIKWNAGVAPTATSVNAKFDIFTFFQDGTNTYGSVFGQNF